MIRATRILSALLLCLALQAAEWKLALPGYRYEFPKDHFDHPGFRTEWWYFTGNLQGPGGRKFGFELTFFRHGLHTSPLSPASAPRETWDTSRLYLAHLALTDVETGRFLHQERLNRPGPGIAGVDATTGRIWNGNWSTTLVGDNNWKLVAVHPEFTLSLNLRSRKPPVIHGEEGVHQKAQRAGRASHYVSLTRLETEGEILLDGESIPVSGSSWMDHEFFTHQMASGQTGWDWFAIQLNDGTELMIYRIRRRDGTIEPLSGGTFIRTDGSTQALRLGDISLTPLETWTSPKTGGTYPVSWRIEVPRIGIDLRAEPRLLNQELHSERKIGPSYWEGAMRFEGLAKGAAVQGVGYLELTGYAGDVNLGEENNRGGITR